jgi:hypothetical protein
MFTTLGYLYNQIHSVVLGTGPLDDRWNRMYYAKPVKLHKGINNPIKFKIRNNNQKDVDITSGIFTLHVMDVATNSEVLTRTLVIENATAGLISTTITEEDLNNFDAIRYYYGIRMISGAGIEYPIYVDDNYSASGVIEVHNTAYPGPVECVEPSIGAYALGVAYTSVVAVTPGNNGISTASYYTTGFTGTITVQGHIEDASAVTESSYINIISSVYTNQTGVAYTNFAGMFKGIRFKLENTSGSVDKILYKY